MPQGRRLPVMTPAVTVCLRRPDDLPHRTLREHPPIVAGGGVGRPVMLCVTPSFGVPILHSTVGAAVILGAALGVPPVQGAARCCQGPPPPPPQGCIGTAVHRRSGGSPPPPSYGGAPLLLVPFQCLRLTAKILLWRLWCQEDLNFGLPPAGTIGGPKEEGGPSQPPPPPPPPPLRPLV